MKVLIEKFLPMTVYGCFMVMKVSLFSLGEHFPNALICLIAATTRAELPFASRLMITVWGYLLIEINYSQRGKFPDKWASFHHSLRESFSMFVCKYLTHCCSVSSRERFPVGLLRKRTNGGVGGEGTCRGGASSESIVPPASGLFSTLSLNYWLNFEAIRSEKKDYMAVRWIKRCDSDRNH